MRDALEYGPRASVSAVYEHEAEPRGDAADPPLLADQLERHEKHLADWFPQTQWLFPSPMHRSAVRGAFHVSPSLSAKVIERYVRTAEIRTAAGELALDVHPHLFRHHLGTSMVNENIPLTVIAQVLDHWSLEMTARYARLHDQTIKREVTAGMSGSTSAASGSRSPSTGRWRSGVDEGTDRARQAGAPERVLRAAAGADMPAPERLPDLRELPHRPRLTAGPRADQPRPVQLLRADAEHARPQRLIELLAGDEHSLNRIMTVWTDSRPPPPNSGPADRSGLADRNQGDLVSESEPPDALRVPRPPARRLDADSPRSAGALRELTSAARSVNFAGGRSDRARVSRAVSLRTRGLRDEIDTLRAIDTAALAQIPADVSAPATRPISARLQAALDENQRPREEIAGCATSSRSRTARARARDLDVASVRIPAMSDWPAPHPCRRVARPRRRVRARSSTAHRGPTRWRCWRSSSSRSAPPPAATPTPVEASRHHPNEFVVLVGPSGRTQGQSVGPRRIAPRPGRPELDRGPPRSGL